MNIFSIFRPKPKSVTVNTYKVKKTDAEKLRDAKCRQLAEEIGWCWPQHPRPKELRDILEEEIDAALARDPTFMSHGGLGL